PFPRFCLLRMSQCSSGLFYWLDFWNAPAEAGRMQTAVATLVELAQVKRLPRSVIAAVCGFACLPVGLLWDISHHSTIGRDTFWTPAHILIQLGGIIPAFLFASIAFRTTFYPSEEERGASVS